MEAAVAGSPDAAETDVATVATTRRLAAPLFQFLAEFHPQNVDHSSSGFSDAFNRWVSSVKVPLSLLIAEFGMITTVPIALRELWADLVARRCHKPVEQLFVPDVGKYEILADDRSAAFLPKY